MVIVRPETRADISAIHAIHRASFPTDAEAMLVDRLRVGHHLTVSLVAEVRDEVVGHIAFSPVSISSGLSGVGLAPVAVSEPHRNRGVATALIRAGLTECRTAGFGWVVVLGEPEYYRRFGFRAAAEFGLNDEYGGGLAFQAVELIPGALPRDAGLVRYGPEFAEFG